ncbi:hypothetical protein ACFOLG_09645, partial [Vogesella facilis]
HLSVIWFVKERADFVSLRRQQRRRTIPIAPEAVNSQLHENPNEFDKPLILITSKNTRHPQSGQATLANLIFDDIDNLDELAI